MLHILHIKEKEAIKKWYKKSHIRKKRWAAENENSLHQFRRQFKSCEKKWGIILV
jgi:hypothetical protein